jgi:hypothetical protein
MYHRERKTGHAEAKESAVQLIKTVRRQMRTKYGTEGKIPMILEGWRGRPSGRRGYTPHPTVQFFSIFQTAVYRCSILRFNWDGGKCCPAIDFPEGLMYITYTLMLRRDRKSCPFCLDIKIYGTVRCSDMLPVWRFDDR